MIEVPYDWDGAGAFCSIECACYAGFMTLRITPGDICKKCFVKGDGFEVQHSPDWVCTRPAVTEELYLQVKARKDERMARFRERIQGRLL